MNLAMLGLVCLLGFVATSSSIIGAALGLYLPMGKRLMACVLAFAAGTLICGLAIDLAFEGAADLHDQGFGIPSAWAFVSGGFALGAVTYYLASLFLDQQGAAVRLPTRFHDYAIGHKQKQSKERIDLLAKCDLLRHLSPHAIEKLLPLVEDRLLPAGGFLFHAGDPGDALYIVARGTLDVLSDKTAAPKVIAQLGEGQVLGEMALISGQPRTASIRALTDAELLRISKDDFLRLIAGDRSMVRAVHGLSHQRAVTNIAADEANSTRWAKVATMNLQLTQEESNEILAETGKGAGLAIYCGSILDTIPGCLVIGAKFAGLQSMSLTLIVAMFLSGIPEAAACAAMLRRAGFTPRAIFLLWSTVIVSGTLAAGAGHVFLGGSQSPWAVFMQGVAGGAVLAEVAHAMIPEAIHGGRSLVVLPTVFGFLFALYLSLTDALS
jgi:CRP-like cAMP-binding protein